MIIFHKRICKSYVFSQPGWKEEWNENEEPTAKNQTTWSGINTMECLCHASSGSQLLGGYLFTHRLSLKTKQKIATDLWEPKT